MSDVHQSSAPLPALDPLLKRYGDGRRRQKMRPYYEKMLVEAQAVSTPQYIQQAYAKVQVPAVQPWLPADTTAVVLAICTLGDPLDRRLDELTQSDIVSATILREIALAWIVAITREIHQDVRTEQALAGLKAGPAFRPGVGRWPLETQHTVFSQLPAAELGVTLTEYLFMLPSMSTSLIIPVMDRRNKKN